LLAGLASLPLARLTVHGRTRPDGYRGRARWDLMHLATQHATAPVVGSGDVVDLASFDALLREAPDLSGVIVGRGALRHPWIFSELRDRKSVSVTPRTLYLALATFAALIDLFAERQADLVRLARDGVFWTPCLTSEDAWEKVAQRLSLAAYDTDAHLGAAHPFPGPIARATLGRVKMLWSYLRSSLPRPLFQPQVLRHRDLGAMLTHISSVAAESADPDGTLPLRHAPDLDWLYSGARKESEDDRANRDSNSLVQAASHASTRQDKIKSSNPSDAGSALGSITSGML
jgi:tRNA-dihydrouridine synthase